MSSGDLIPTVLSFLLTLLVISYVWRDNPLFRFTIHLFVGVAAGYAGAIAYTNVIYLRILYPVFQSLTGGSFETLLVVFPPLALGLLLFAKLSPRFAWVGNPSMAFMVGVGAAAAVGGSVLGTLFPQIEATTDLFGAQSSLEISPTTALFQAATILIGTLMTLSYFHFSVRQAPDRPRERGRFFELLAWGGQVFIAITFGVLFAGVYAAALTSLIERLSFLANFVLQFF